MSTIDPAEAKRQREQDRIGRPGSLVWLAFGDLAIVVGSALFSRAMFAFGTIPPEGTNDPPPGVFGMAAGLPLMMFGFFTHIGALRRYTGKTLGRSPFLGIFPLVFIGLTAGAWWGWKVDSSEPWMWIPLALTALAIVAVAWTISSRISGRRRRRRLADMLNAGRIVAGTITQIDEIDASSGGLLGPVTVTFTDAQGTQRWVTKMGQWSSINLPKNGDAATVLFDPAAPGDTRRIWVGPPGARTADDFTTWTD